MFPLRKRLIFITCLSRFTLLIVKGTELTQERWYCFSENHGDLGKPKLNHQTKGCGFRLSLCLSLAFHDFWSQLHSTIESETLPAKSLNIFSLNKKFEWTILTWNLLTYWPAKIPLTFWIEDGWSKILDDIRKEVHKLKASRGQKWRFGGLALKEWCAEVLGPLCLGVKYGRGYAGPSATIT